MTFRMLILDIPNVIFKIPFNDCCKSKFEELYDNKQTLTILMIQIYI